jgi:LPXTG-site transpeptidase (sortase) family protein
MQSKIVLKWPLLIIGIAGITLSLIIIFLPTLTLPGPSPYAKQIPPPENRISQNLIESASAGSIQNITSSEQADLGLPVRLKIPKIGIDAVVESVGLTSEGAMDVPKGPSDVAWLKLGSRPGEHGSAVISGHYGWKNGVPAAFDNLSELRAGDKIYVVDKSGKTIAFAVRELRTYGENDDASDVFGSDDGTAHLNLITCEGAWNKTRKSYSDRLVAFADKVTE